MDNRRSTKGGLRLSAPRKKRKGLALKAYRKRQKELECLSLAITAEYTVELPQNPSNGLNHRPDTHTTPQKRVNGETGVEIAGKRIVDIAHFFSVLQALNHHGPVGCTLSDMEIISDEHVGPFSGITMKCKICNFSSILWTEKLESTAMPSNTVSLGSVIKIEGGFSNLEELPSTSTNAFVKELEKVGGEADLPSDKESELAEKCKKNSEGIQTVTAVESWAKKSYHNNYSSGVQPSTNLEVDPIIHPVIPATCSHVTSNSKQYSEYSSSEVHNLSSTDDSAVRSNVTASNASSGVRCGNVCGNIFESSKNDSRKHPEAYGIDYSFDCLKSLTEKTKPDEYSVYMELFAKLRTLDGSTRKIAMIEINNLLLRLNEPHSFSFDKNASPHNGVGTGAMVPSSFQQGPMPNLFVQPSSNAHVFQSRISVASSSQCVSSDIPFLEMTFQAEPPLEQELSIIRLKQEN